MAGSPHRPVSVDAMVHGSPENGNPPASGCARPKLAHSRVEEGRGFRLGDPVSLPRSSVGSRTGAPVLAEMPLDQATSPAPATSVGSRTGAPVWPTHFGHATFPAPSTSVLGYAHISCRVRIGIRKRLRAYDAVRFGSLRQPEDTNRNGLVAWIIRG